MIGRFALLLLTVLVATLCPIAKAFTTASEVATLEFLSEFVDEFVYLRGRWTDSDYCKWEGISCDSRRYVSINLANTSLNGYLPTVDSDYLGSDVMVTSIDLSNNTELSGFLRPSWGTLTNLKFLNLSFTSVGGTIPTSWSGMRSLESISMSSMQLCGSMPAWNIQTLRHANFSYNFLGGRLAPGWSKMTSLRTLDISGNGFCGCVPPMWAAHPTLLEAADAANTAVRSRYCSENNLCRINLNARCSNAAHNPQSATLLAGCAIIIYIVLWLC